MKRKKRKLQLNRSTVRTLAAEEIDRAAGGALNPTVYRCSSGNTSEVTTVTYHGCTDRITNRSR